jgi:streptomycin 6-kinase
MATIRLQPLTRARVRSLGGAGTAWLDALPRTLAELEERWSLRIGRPLPGGSASYVARAETRDGAERVVKVVVPDPDLADEARTLAAADGRGYALLHAHDPDRNALLLEALGPSLESAPAEPERKLAVLADTLREAWQVPAATAEPPAPGEDKATSLARLVLDLDRRLGHPCPTAALDLALEYADRRAAAHRLEDCVVVHGDPHPANTLRVTRPRAGAESGYVFVDTDGFLADPAYDLGVVLRDWTGRLADARSDLAARRLLEGYAALLADHTGIDAQRVWEWGFLERVSTGLYVMGFGGEEIGRRFLSTAARLARAR